MTSRHILLCAATALWLALMAAMGPEPALTPASAYGCQEDEACWNCQTMGNRTCGPLTNEGNHR